MNDIFRETLFNRLRDWMLQAGAMIREQIYDPLTINTKSNPKDLVTDMDRKVEFFFAGKIKHFYPDHILVSEEGYGDDPASVKGTIWIVDPIDGTMNFVNQKKNFAISIGIYHDGIGEIGMVYDVMSNQLYSGLRGEGAYRNDMKLPKLDVHKRLENSIICLNHHWLTPNRAVDERYLHKLIKDVRGSRSTGSAALELMHVAEGSADAYITMYLSPWDFAAGRIILQETGGVISNIEGKTIGILDRSSVIASNPAIANTLIQAYLLPAWNEKRHD